MASYSFKAETSGIRADKYLSEKLPELSRSFIQNCFMSGCVIINGVPASKSLLLNRDDMIEMSFMPPRELDAEPQNIPLDVLYEDEDLLIVNKPKGMVVHPAHGSPDKTLVNALLYHCGSSLSGINGVLRPGIIHRIDKDTSGLLIVAKNDSSHNLLSEQIKAHSFERVYEAVCVGNVAEDSLCINEPIGRHPKDRKKMAVTQKNSRNAVTHVTVLKRYNGYTHIRCRLETGRTHQIRVHLTHLGHPLLGDTFYGGKRCEFKGIHGQCLHAKSIGFIHPSTQTYRYFESPLPEYFVNVLTKLENML